ncbi:O-methyltransferase [Metabacillus herbersteinensis]|uniref:tRNA 5-hydroxyuridine methyltransferase n=1 Tax=Metabacillus herbersteinensis TaxID=283816 RepID=A0ABV6G9A0_9BACI
MIKQEVLTYLEKLIPGRTPYVEEMEQYAGLHGVPIMEKTGVELLLLLLSMQQPKKILEIGTAIGYSAIRMAMKLPEAEIITIERDETRYQQAREYITKLNLETRIHLLLGDALEISEEVRKQGPFDALFIDAAKSQSRGFFNLYEPMLAKQGLIITDNVLFKGIVAKDVSEIDSRNVRQLVRKINTYNEWLYTLPNYETTIIPVGDGIAVSRSL